MNFTEFKEQYFDVDMTNERLRKRIQYVSVYGILFIVSIAMTVINILTDKGMLTWMVAAFAVMCAVNWCLVKFLDVKGMKVSIGLFTIEILLLFMYFLISGNPEGYSAIWVLLLPSCGMLLFGRKTTVRLSMLVFVILIILLWTSFGDSILQYDYSDSFKDRFPITFFSIFILSFVWETIRLHTHWELEKLKKDYQQLSLHDALTGVYNRLGLFEHEKESKVGESQAVLMMDLDYFKSVNDKYGHDVGDKVLMCVSKEMERVLDNPVCRWGGEEFVSWYPEGLKDKDISEKFRKSVEDLKIEIDDNKTISVTVSIGEVTTDEKISLEDLINRADVCLYKAKEGGRNRVVKEKD